MNRLAGEPLDDLVLGDVAHDDCLLGRIAVSNSETRLRDVSPSLPRWIVALRLNARERVHIQKMDMVKVD